VNKRVTVTTKLEAFLKCFIRVQWVSVVVIDRCECQNDFGGFFMQRMVKEQKDSHLDLERLDSARKRLQENYQEAQNGKFTKTFCTPAL
jgi:hypothetical protein